MATSEPDGKTRLLLGHTASGEVVRIGAAGLAGLTVWGDHGSYLARLAGQLARQGMGVTYVGKAVHHPPLLAAAPASRQAKPLSGWPTTHTVRAWLTGRQVAALELVSGRWLGELIQYHQQAARELAAAGQSARHALVLDCHPDLYLQVPLLGLLQSRCLLPFLSLRSATLCNQPVPDGVLRLVFRSGAGAELARDVLRGGRSGEDVEQLRAGWAYLAGCGEVAAIHTARPA